MIKKVIQHIFNRNKNELKAIQCLWDSDFNYLGISIELIITNGKGYIKQTLNDLNYNDFKSQEELVQKAERIGKKLAKKYNIEYYFPSPDEFLRTCPDWWEVESAIKCEDCKVPIIPTTSKFLPKEICYPCHLTRENNEQIKKNNPCKDGVTMYLFKEGEFQKTTYTSKLESFKIIPSNNLNLIKKDSICSVNTVVIEKKEIIDFMKKLKNEIDEEIRILKASGYKNISQKKTMSKLDSVRSVVYNGVKYEFKRTNDNVLELILSYNIAKKATNEGYSYKIYFKKGMNYREESVLRFLKYRCKGIAEKAKIKEQFFNIISEEELEKTILKLVKIGCLSISKNKVLIAEKGNHII